jgi:hypothetical protein
MQADIHKMYEELTKEGRITEKKSPIEDIQCESGVWNFEEKTQKPREYNTHGG